MSRPVWLNATNMVLRPLLQHVIVDGSNVATEGRETPSLAQLDEAVQAFIREYEPEIVTVVVDATFPNRIARNERKSYEEAVVAGEIITPPAGAIGRGDAFVLEIADRAGATVLSNDSFQEFHGRYDWLFDEGRLIGGKPVPHVGWVFMPRTPVRGPASRRAVSAARRDAAPKTAQARPQAAPVVPAAPEAAKPKRAPRKAKPKDKAKSAPAQAPATAPTEAPAQAPTEVPAQAPTEVPAPTPVPSGTPKSAGRPAPAPPTVPVDDQSLPVAYNEALPFIEFVGDHPVGSEVDAVVERFGSHGAYLRIGDVRAYAPLKNLADPAPRSAKEVVKVGEARRFVVAAIDPPRRGIDLAIPTRKPPRGRRPAKASATTTAKRAAAPKQAEGAGKDEQPQAEKAQQASQPRAKKQAAKKTAAKRTAKRSK